MKILAGISPIVFHATTLDRARKILTKNQFLLVHSGFSQIETNMSKKDREYYMSTARNRHSDYVMRNGEVIFTLDGRKLGQRYKGEAVDYWGAEFRAVDKTKYEQEDRIFSSKPKIPNAVSYIKEISVLKRNTMNPWFAHNLYYVLDAATSNNIPIYIYEDKSSYLAGNKKRAMNMQDFLDSLSKFMDIPENKYEERPDREFELKELRAYNDFFKVLEYQVRSEVTSFGDASREVIDDEKSRKEAYNVQQRMPYKSDFVSQLSNAIQNARSNMSEAIADEMEALSKLMRKYKVSSFVGLYEKALELKTKINETERKQYIEKSTRKFMTDMRDLGFTFDAEYDSENVLKDVYLKNLKFSGGKLDDEALSKFVQMLLRLDNLGFYDILFLYVQIADAKNEEQIYEFLSKLGFTKRDSHQYGVMFSNFRRSVYDNIIDKRVVSRIKTLTTRN